MVTFQASELTSCQAVLEKERKDLRVALETESGSLRAQLQSHADSIKILVAEKADFENSLRKLNAELASKNGENSMLFNLFKNVSAFKYLLNKKMSSNLGIQKNVKKCFLWRLCVTSCDSEMIDLNFIWNNINVLPISIVNIFSWSAELVRLQQSNSSEAEAARRELERAEIKAEVESRIGAELERVRQELRQSKQTTEDLQQEVAELGSKVNAKDKANEALKADLKLKTSKLEMAELNLAQLRAAKDSDESRREEAERLAEKEAELARVTSENVDHIQVKWSY